MRPRVHDVVRHAIRVRDCDSITMGNAYISFMGLYHVHFLDIGMHEKMKFSRINNGADGTSRGRMGSHGAIRNFHNSKAGIAVATALALLLWWVPYLGPMVAGFMGGRKGGSIARGAMVGAISCAAVIGIATGASMLLDAVCTGFGDAIAGFSSDLHAKLVDAGGYLGTLVVVGEGSVQVDTSDYFLMVAMSVIGGAFADQSRMEARAIVSLANEASTPQEPRSVKAHRENRPIAFHTYEDYSRMSVNSAAPPAETRKAQAERRPLAATRVAPEAATKMTQQASEAVPTSSVQTTRPDDVPEPRKAFSSGQSQAGDYDYL